MKIKLAWIVDPATKKESVSLTNLSLSILLVLTATGLNLAGLTKDTSIALDYFAVSAALYFGRRLNIAGKSYDAAKEEETNEAQNQTNN